MEPLPGQVAEQADGGAPVYTDPDADKKKGSAKYTVEHWEQKRDASAAWEPAWEGTPWERESEEARLERVLGMALEADHPGIDEEGVDTMIGFVQQGRFAAAHYIDMWSTRLAEMGIAVESRKGATQQLEELAAARAAEEAAAAAAAAEAEAEMRRPKPPPHPRSLRLRLQDDDLGDGFTEALQGLLRLLPYATLEESGRLRDRVRSSLLKRAEYEELLALFGKASKYYGMYRVRIEPPDGGEGGGEREELHFTDRAEAVRNLKKLWPAFHDGVVAARRHRLAYGAQSLGAEFNTTMELLVEQLWGAEEPEQEAFVVAVRRALTDGERFESLVSAVADGEDEYGYRSVLVAGARGPQKFHVVSPEQTVALLHQLSAEFVSGLELRTKRDMAGENADDDDEDEEQDQPDSELGDLKDMVEALAPMSGEALVAVAEEQEEEQRWQSRLPSWGSRFLVGDLYAQAAWLRQHAAKGDPGLDELEATTLQAYVLWFLGGFATGFHWLYLAWKARSRRRRWVRDSKRALELSVGSPPPPPELICGITGKVMEDPHTLRIYAKGKVAANTPHSKMFHCDHTFEGQVRPAAAPPEAHCSALRPADWRRAHAAGAARLLTARAQVPALPHEAVHPEPRSDGGKNAHVPQPQVRDADQPVVPGAVRHRHGDAAPHATAERVDLSAPRRVLLCVPPELLGRAAVGALAGGRLRQRPRPFARRYDARLPVGRAAQGDRCAVHASSRARDAPLRALDG